MQMMKLKGRCLSNNFKICIWVIYFDSCWLTFAVEVLPHVHWLSYWKQPSLQRAADIALVNIETHMESCWRSAKADKKDEVLY